MNIYIELDKKKQIIGKTNIVINDVANVVVDDSTQLSKIKNIELLKTTYKDEYYIITMLDVIKSINETIGTSHNIQAVGEKECIVDCLKEKKKENAVLEYLKVIFIGSIIFMGSITAIMSFQLETDMQGLLQKFIEIVTGGDIKNKNYVTVPYSVGITTGIIIFFNHLGSKKLTKDPTPIEVEMSKFELGVTDTVIEIVKNKGEAQ